MNRKTYIERFGKNPDIEVKSPGRINIIGEHTDYNDGFVLPAAIDKYAYVSVGKRDDDTISLYATEFSSAFETTIADIAPRPGQWTNYILGVVDEMVKRNLKIGGFNLVLSADIPVGAGLSSSAAIECAAGYALDQLFGLRLSKFDIARIGQLAEHFAGLQCGIMDEFASCFGKKDHALKLDCRSLEYEEVPLSLAGYKILLLNTNVSHSLASSEYNTRKEECDAGVEMVKKHHSDVLNLRDVTVDMLDEYVKDPLVYKRCRFVIEENNRVHQSVEYMKKGDIKGLGQQMLRSHKGLSKEYEVSCAELDWLVDAVKDNEAVAGSRMMGGGFGGCTINIVKEEAIEKLVDGLKARYEEKFGKKLSVYEANTSGGTTLF